MAECLGSDQPNSPDNTPRTFAKACYDDFLGDMRVRGFSTVDDVDSSFDPSDGSVPEKFVGSKTDLKARFSPEDLRQIHEIAQMVTREILNS
jgi:hypothetical protein